MKKKNKILISIIILFGLIIGIGYYLLIPNQKIEANSDAKLITAEELLKGSFIDYGEILKNPLRLKGKISITDKEFKDIIYTIMTKYNIKEFEKNYANIEENKIRVITPYNILGVDTQIEVNIEPRVENNDLYLTLTNFKVGKIKISNELLSSQLDKQKSKIPFGIDKNTIIIEEENFLPIIIDKVYIENNNIIVELEIKATNILEFIKDYEVKIK
ncbi:hypothetical protein [Romboutsia sp.]|uniref:hypothetical protein n=1 Tax=Romboutsia sp. TaxID=1965302 RepID=UPI003F31D20B